MKIGIVRATLVVMTAKRSRDSSEATKSWLPALAFALTIRNINMTTPNSNESPTIRGISGRVRPIHPTIDISRMYEYVLLDVPLQ